MEIGPSGSSVFQGLCQRHLPMLNHVRAAKGATPRNACSAVHQHPVFLFFVHRILYEFVAPIKVRQNLLCAVVAYVFENEVLHSFVFEEWVCVGSDCQYVGDAALLDGLPVFGGPVA